VRLTQKKKHHGKQNLSYSKEEKINAVARRKQFKISQQMSKRKLSAGSINAKANPTIAPSHHSAYVRNKSVSLQLFKERQL